MAKATLRKKAGVELGREVFLQALDTAAAGLAQAGQRNKPAQSDCFVFQDGELLTFNDLTAVRMPSPLKREVTGAVDAEKLLELLRALPDEAVLVRPGKGYLEIHGKGRKGGVAMDPAPELQVELVEAPGAWAPLSADFGEAVDTVHHVAGSPETSSMALTCVNATARWVEAGSPAGAIRWVMDTGLQAPVLLRADSVKYVASLGATEVSEGESWIHFRNARGTVLSCRRFTEEFPTEELTKFLQVEGAEVAFPKQLAAAADRAYAFAKDNPQLVMIKVLVEPGHVRVSGEGVRGFYDEWRKKGITYAGPKLEFYISPEVFKGVLEQCEKCIANNDFLLVGGNRYQYVASLTAPPAADAGPAAAEEGGDGD
jgi:hypothetical protein